MIIGFRKKHMYAMTINIIIIVGFWSLLQAVAFYVTFRLRVRASPEASKWFVHIFDFTQKITKIFPF